MTPSAPAKAGIDADELTDRAARQTANGKRGHNLATFEAEGKRHEDKARLDGEIVRADRARERVLEQVHARAFEVIEAKGIDEADDDEARDDNRDIGFV